MSSIESLNQNTEFDPSLEKGNFIELLNSTAEVQPLPSSFVPSAVDSYDTYMNRVEDTRLESGIYIANLRFGETTLQDIRSSPEEFRFMNLKNSIDTRDTNSGNGFFALQVMSEETSNTVDLAFRPFNPGVNNSPEEDFTRNLITRHIGLENTQTVGLYTDGAGVGGTISLLDRNIRSADTIKVGDLDNADPFHEILAGAARETAFAHSKKVLHNDLALRNVVRDNDGRVHLIDWGGATLIDNDPGGIDKPRTPADDIAVLENDFVFFRPSIDGRDGDRSTYRQAYVNSFVNPYVHWRQSFNSEMTKSEGRMPNNELVGELGEIVERFAA